MEDIIKLGLTEEEAIAMDKQVEQMLAAMQKANERMARDWIEIEHLKAETKVLLADLERKLGGRDVEITSRSL
ncbi:MAG: hypothetical protein M3X11_05230 [Acidobacteriota bacterium]|nr:hypothetical protein [Acidobacteriota bacterium]